MTRVELLLRVLRGIEDERPAEDVIAELVEEAARADNAELCRKSESTARIEGAIAVLDSLIAQRNQSLAQRTARR